MSTAVQPNFYPAGFDPQSASVVTHEFFQDMADAILDSTHWVVTEDTGGNTQVLSDVQHGVMLLTNAATTDNDASQVAWANETFVPTAGKRIYYECRIRAAAGATQIDLFCGLADTEDLTGVADNMPAVGIGFRKDDGDAYIDACSSDAGTDSSSAAIGTLVANTWIKLGFVFDGGASGSAKIYPFIDGIQCSPIESVTYASTAMSAIFMVRNGDATTTQTLEIDYVRVIAER